MKYFTDIGGSQRKNFNDFGDPLTFPPAPSRCHDISGFMRNVVTTIGWLAMKFGLNIKGLQWMNPTEFALAD